MTTVVLLSYGRESEYRRAIMAILSFWAWSSDHQARVLLFTDKPKYFAPFLAGLPVDYRLITAEEMQEIKGEQNFIHLVKVSVVNEASNTLQPGDKMVFIDSDTYFQADPAALLARISDTVSVMHMHEYVLGEFVSGNAADVKSGKLFIKMIEEKEFATSQGVEKFYAGQSSWNSGVVGMSKTVATSVMPDIKPLTTTFFQHTQWHTAEQMAFALVLQTRTEVVAASPYIFHYWSLNEKRAMDSILAEKLTQAVPQLPLTERLALARQWAVDMPSVMQAYFAKNAEIGLQLQARQAFEKKQVFRGYKYSLLAILKAPSDSKFIKDVLYYTKNQLLGYTIKRS